jgi:hypothetical protein
MTFIATIPESEATGELAEAMAAWRATNPDRKNFPGILSCFTHRPDFLKQVMAFSYGVHFSDGHINRRTKEMIATFVSGLNRCPY